MPKGYWIGHIDVKDMEAYKKYAAGVQAPFAKFGARYLVRGGAIAHAEGQNKPRTVVIEFPSIEAARACYEAPEYRDAMQHRIAAALADLVVIEGYDGAQPGG